MGHTDYVKARFYSELIVVTLIGVGCGSCGKKQPPQFPPGDFNYPHPKTWSADHVSHYLTAQANGTNEKSADKPDCMTCHRSRPKGLAMNVSCAVACHSRMTSEERHEKYGLDETIKAKPAGDNACLKCHTRMNSPEKQFLHYPSAAGLCTTCHEATPKHLEGSDKKAVTTSKTNESCLRCHFRNDDKKHVHAPLGSSKSSCLTCHDPHGTNQRAFIRKPGIAALCASCHTTPAGKSVHAVISGKKDCLSCHVPHSADSKGLLTTADDQTLCLSCHNKTIQSHDGREIADIKGKLDLASPHKVAQGNCKSCHNAHASPHDRLLIAKFSMNTYNLYSPEADKNPYALCFRCHNQSLVQQNSFTTRFRHETKNGQKLVQQNLHWFHVADAAGSYDKAKGRSCAICHDAHGAPQAHDINAVWRMNQGTNSLTYKSTPDGGSCTTACHAERTYQRLTARDPSSLRNPKKPSKKR